MPNMSEQGLKVTYGSTKRRFVVSRAIDYSDFREQLLSLFGIKNTGDGETIHASDISFSYQDSDGDTIAVSSEAELREMFRITNTPTLLMTLHIPSTPASQAHETASRAAHEAEAAAARAAEGAHASAARAAEGAHASAARAAEGAQASVESVLSGLGSFLSAFQTGFGPGTGPGFGAGFGGAGFGGGRHHRGHGHGRGRGRSRSRGGMDFSAFAPFMAAFAPMAAAFHQGSGMYDVSERTSTAFRQLSDAVVGAENRDDILRTARDAFPSVREWAMANLSGDGDINQSAIDELCNTVSQRVQPVAGERIAGFMTELIRVALADEAVLRMLRNIPWEATEGLDAEIRGPGGRGGPARGGRFDIHRRIECDNCGKSPIVGSRYKATNRPNYDLCGECYSNESVNKEGLEFKECKFVWEASYPDVAVPPSPIGFGDRGPSVAFLQKVLTDLGYMNASMYRWRVGFYGPNTRNAVEQFQREYGLETVAETGQYDATTAASLTSVLEAQVPPSASTGGAASSDAPAAAQAGPGADAPGPEPSPAQG